MPRFKTTYPPEMRTSEHGQRLYETWKRIRKKPHDPAFDDYAFFYKWSMQNGYCYGARIYLLYIDAPYGPDNCVWRDAACKEQPIPPRDRGWESLWNKTVNRIRVYYGLEPFPVEVAGDD